MRTLIWYTDVISALVRATEPLRVAIKDAERRDDVELMKFLNATYLPLRKKLLSCVKEGKREEDWTTNELSDADAALLANMM